jgi:hypothetical protein
VLLVRSATVFTLDNEEIPLDEFAAAGKRFNVALRAHDPRTFYAGIFVLDEEGKKRLFESPSTPPEMQELLDYATDALRALHARAADERDPRHS